ncbi:MAG: dihydrodipicolinate synthase family protein, partial [Planctomycetota bacterium]
MDYKEHPWMGVFPATLCAFRDDQSVDEDGLRSYIRDLCAVEGLKGLVCNGHTGEIMSLRPKERAEVTHVFATEVKKSGKPVRIISGVSAGGSLEAIDDALAAKEAGADAILLMPPHHWLRFGRSSQT